MNDGETENGGRPPPVNGQAKPVPATGAASDLGAEGAAAPILVDVSVPPGGSFDAAALRDLAAAGLDLSPSDLMACRLDGRSLDARRKGRIHWVCRLRVTLADALLARDRVQAGRARPVREPGGTPPDREILSGQLDCRRSKDAGPPVIVGSGPAGLFAAWLLARHGRPPLVLERGRRVEERVKDVRSFERGGRLDPESNLVFGEGGAGTFSDGKLTSRSKSPLARLVLSIVADCHGPPEVLIDARPHVGTDRLRAVLVHLRRRLESLGVVFRFGDRVDDLLLDGGTVTGVRLAGGEVVSSDAVVLAIGHSARDTYAMLASRGVAMEFKPFQMGLRIEHPQEMINQAQYGSVWRDLPAADYTLRGPGPRPTYSFCMCPGGIIVPSVSEPDHLCLNGMSRRRRDSAWATSGLVFTVTEDDLGPDGADPLAGVALQRLFERRAFELGGGAYAAPAQRVVDFLAGRPTRDRGLETSYPLGVRGADLHVIVMPKAWASMHAALQAFDRKIPGFAGETGVLVGPEARGSSPVRLPRDPRSLESISAVGLYPCGEGAGHAGGIVSAAIDGLRVARAILVAAARR